MTTAVLLFGGLALLILGGDALVRGAVALSLRLGIPALIVSLTVVALGTSLPELLVSVQAALSGSPDIAIGNVVGSNIINVLLVLGIPAVISGFDRSATDTRESFAIMIAASVLVIVLACFGRIGHLGGLILVACMVLMLAHSVQRGRRAPPQDDPPDPGLSLTRTLFYLAAGLVLLPVGADFFVDASVRIARAVNVSETVIGLTLVAIGTSLPELATTVMAAIRRHTDVALGNVIGSNVFNILGILGVTALVAPLSINPQILHLDIWVMLAASAALFPFVFLGWHLGRRAGAALIAAYAAYTMVLLA